MYLFDLRYIADEFVCYFETKIKMSKKCDGVYDCTGSDEYEWICEYHRTRNHSKLKLMLF